MKNKLAEDCHNCDLRPTCKQVVWGSGNSGLWEAEDHWDMPRIMLIAEAPGKQEDKLGVPLVGRTGEETDWLLARYGLKRSNIYCTNVVKCRPVDNKDPKPHQIEACIPWLEQELGTIKPELVIAMGRFSTRYFLPAANMEMANGVPYQVRGFTLVPVYHVAAGLHNPSTMMGINAGFKTVKDVLAGARVPRHVQDPYEGREEYFELGDGDL